MKKFKVSVEFHSGQRVNFTTKSDVRKDMYRLKVNGEDCIVTDDNYVLNISKIKELKVKKISRNSA
ncbi:hypothetical protein JCM9140_295 [Halalkalibacter wakoensis JCM 9140]|uniref:Uncharacterized protein n=1 Tax=Halalkalibacter wakoensis JCM 9140 TaxID=1236970 RepID=W4PY27_9BACI|nr:hypothetical protein [Halalkalibacter wakoensis]GAE24378.1 hypothetical protein JCM9140_295 [Halalkalibacter wakoensis JCM 9140]